MDSILAYLLLVTGKLTTIYFSLSLFTEVK